MTEHTDAPHVAFPAAMVDDLSLHYGVHVGSIGEDGDMIALGHHDTRRVIAAFNRYARTELGLQGMTDYRGAFLADVVDEMKTLWATLMIECEDATEEWHAQEGRCSTCVEIKASKWWLRWDARASGVDAFPVMIWEV